jgi:glycosyltransferase involved in cell wall biosynthesis
MENPYISVVIRAFNRQDYLLKAVNSALKQTLEKDKYEILVVKNFISHLDKYLEENKVRIFFEDGIAGELIKCGVENSRGTIISFLDDDDYFAETKLERVFKIFNSNPKVTYFHNSYHAINELGEDVEFEHRTIDFNMSCISIKKEAVKVGLIAKISFFQDPIIFTLALEHEGMLINSDEELTFYVKHESTSNIFSGNFEENIKQTEIAYQNYLKSAEIILPLLKRERSRKYLKAMITDLKMGRFQFDINLHPEYVLNYFFCKYIPFKRRWVQLRSYIALRISPRKARNYILHKREQQFILEFKKQ